MAGDGADGVVVVTAELGVGGSPIELGILSRTEVVDVAGHGFSALPRSHPAQPSTATVATATAASEVEILVIMHRR